MVCLNGTLGLRATGRMKLLLEGMFELKEKPGPGLCLVKGCRTKHVPKKWGGSLCLCAKHRQARWRHFNPKQAAFDTLRMHARARKIEFTLTFKRFVEITDAAGYWDQKPDTQSEWLTVDRKEGHLGYSDNNVQVITKGENSGKSNRERWLPEHIQAMLARKRAQPAWQMSGPAEDGWLGEPDPF